MKKKKNLFTTPTEKPHGRAVVSRSFYRRGPRIKKKKKKNAKAKPPPNKPGQRKPRRQANSSCPCKLPPNPRPPPGPETLRPLRTPEHPNQPLLHCAQTPPPPPPVNRPQAGRYPGRGCEILDLLIDKKKNETVRIPDSLPHPPPPPPPFFFFFFKKKKNPDAARIALESQGYPPQCNSSHRQPKTPPGQRCAYPAPATNEVGHLAETLGAFLFARCPEGTITYREQALRHARTWWRMHRNAAFSVVVCALPCSLDMFAGGLETFSGERGPSPAGLRAAWRPGHGADLLPDGHDLQVEVEHSTQWETISTASRSSPRTAPGAAVTATAERQNSSPQGSPDSSVRESGSDRTSSDARRVQG